MHNELKVDLYSSTSIIIILKKPWSCLINSFVLLYKEMKKNIKVQHNKQRVTHFALFETN